MSWLLKPIFWAIHFCLIPGNSVPKLKRKAAANLFCFHLIEWFSVLFEAPLRSGSNTRLLFALGLSEWLEWQVISLSCVLTTGTYHTEQGDGGQVQPFLSYVLGQIFLLCFKQNLFVVSHLKVSLFWNSSMFCWMQVLPYLKNQIVRHHRSWIGKHLTDTAIVC